MTDVLHHAGTNPVEKKEIELEVEAWRTYDAMFATERNKLKKDLDESRKEVKEKDKAISEKAQALNEKDQAYSEKDQVIEELKKQMSELLKNQGGKS
jgi:septal ring factor EnvC (AmiA/AmiB activator)